jgi:hypothetical protein
MVAVAAYAQLPELDASIARLMRNQEEIGNALGTTPENKEELTNLWKVHIKIALELATALFGGKSEEVMQEISKRWFANATDIASTMSRVRPAAWKSKIIENMMFEHLNLLTKDLIARVGQEWEENIVIQDEQEKHMTHFAMIIANGLEE